MSILVLGGRGKTATHLAILLQQHNISFVVASRNPTESGSFQHLRFDWLDESTYDNVIAPSMDRIGAIYMVAPEVPDCLTPMKRFIDHARQRGAKRFVLLSSSAIAAGGPFFGKVHEYLCTLEVEYSVLRPSWFQENFTDLYNHDQIVQEGNIYSATRDGKVAFISAKDIAMAAFHLLTAEKSSDTDHILQGPELLSYDEVAAIISEKSGRRVKHERITVANLGAKYVQVGMPVEYAQTLAALENDIGDGSEAPLGDEFFRITGRAPQSFRTFADENFARWL